jgi:general stress protein CsbA
MRGIFHFYLDLKKRCPRCQYKFEREDGYFLGGYALNVFFVGLIPLLLLVLFFVYTDYSWVMLELIFIPLAVLLPALLFPYTRTFWMAIDLFLDPMEHTERRLRYDKMQPRR